MWRRSLQPESLNLVRVLAIHNSTWLSARVSPLPHFVTPTRYWAELRDDVLILYPLSHLHLLYKTLQVSPDPTHPFPLSTISEPQQLETLPPAQISALAARVASVHVLAFVLTSPRLVFREHHLALSLRSRLARPGVRIIFDSPEHLGCWRDDLLRARSRVRKRLSDFDILRHVGKGASGRVYEVHDRITSERFALKVIEKSTVFESKDTYRHAMDERLVLQMIRHHPYILDLRYAFQNAKRLFLVTEFCAGGDLFEFMNRRVAPLDEQSARFLAAQILLALGHLHSLGIVYRDLKLENILVDEDGHARLADFGLTKVLRQPDGSLCRTATFCGTREYVAPEMLRGDAYDTSLDMWTFGILLYEMLSGRTPFYTSDTADIYKRIEKAPVFYPRNLSDAARDLLSKLLVRDPEKRLGCGGEGIAEIQRHPWFRTTDWEAMECKKGLVSPLKQSMAYVLRESEMQARFQSGASGSTSSILSRGKDRKLVKQQRALAEVVADAKQELRMLPLRNADKKSSTGSLSGSILSRPRSSIEKHREGVLAGYSFYDPSRRTRTDWGSGEILGEWAKGMGSEDGCASKDESCGGTERVLGMHVSKMMSDSPTCIRTRANSMDEEVIEVTCG